MSQLDLKTMSFKQISVVDIQVTDKDWSTLMETRSGVECKEPMPEWFIEQYKDNLNFAAFSQLVRNHLNTFTDAFLKKYSMFLILRPVLDAIQDPKYDRLKRLFYMGPIQDITMDMLDKDPGYYERGAWDGFITFYKGIMPPDFVARHLNRLNLYLIAINPFILNGVELLKMFSFSAGASRVLPDGSRITGQRRYAGRMFLRSAARFDTYSQAAEETNREFAEKCDKYYPSAMLTEPTAEDCAKSLKSAMTSAKRSKINCEGWLDKTPLTADEYQKVNDILGKIDKLTEDTINKDVITEILNEVTPLASKRAFSILHLLCTRALSVNRDTCNEKVIQLAIMQENTNEVRKAVVEVGYDKQQTN